MKVTMPDEYDSDITDYEGAHDSVILAFINSSKKNGRGRYKWGRGDVKKN